MKNNKGSIIVSAIIVILIILILIVIYSLTYQTCLSDSTLNIIDNNVSKNIKENIIRNVDNKESENNVIENIQPIFSNSEENEEINITNEGKYYYNQLDNYGKIIYEKLKQNKSQLSTGTYVFNFDKKFNELLHSQGGQKQLNEAFQSAWNAFSYDETDLFYIDINKISLINETHSFAGISTYYISIGPGDNSNYLQNNFKSQEEIRIAQNYISNIVEQIRKQTAQDSDVQKIKKVHDWLVNVIEYDSSQKENNKYNIYGALHDKKAVCEGYARAFNYIMEEIGIPCVLVSGKAKNSEGTIETHAWNYVKIEEKWYAIDVTWDDPVIIGNGKISEKTKYKYFLVGSTDFFKDHTEEGKVSDNSIEFKFPILCTENYEN